MYGLNVLEPKEPNNPPLIERFLKKLKTDSTYKLNSTDERKEKALNLAKKRFMSSSFEDHLEGKAKEFARDKRLGNK